MLQSFLRGVSKLLIGVIALVVATILLHHILSSSWLGEDLRSAYDEYRSLAARRYQDYAALISQHGPMLGLMGTLLSGGWAIHKTLYYADHNLPARLKEYLERNDQRLLGALPLQLEQITRTAGASKVGEPVAFYGPLTQFLRSKGFPSPNHLLPELGSQAKELATQIDVNERNLQGLKTAKAAVHILNGAACAAQATMLRTESEHENMRRRHYNQNALREFEAALAVDPDNLDALELSAKQLMLLGDANARLQLEKLRDAAERRKNSIRRARALRLLGELHEHSGVLVRLRTDAKDLLKEAVEELSHLTQRSDELTLEKARVFETLARIRMKLNQKPGARDNYRKARGHYAELGTELGRDRIRHIDEQLSG